MRSNERQVLMSVSAVRRTKCGRLACRAGLLLPTVLLSGCTASLKFGDGAYSNCRDLGDLALTAESRADAEQRMRAQVLELGGDTLLFDERPRAESGAAPEELIERRDRLTSAVPDASQPAIVEVSSDAVAESLDAPDEEADVRDNVVLGPVDRGRVRRGRISMEPVAATPGRLWYYGAALRCNR